MSPTLSFVQFVPEPVLLQSFADGLALPLTAITSLFLIMGLVNIYLYRKNEATADRLQQTPVSAIDSLTDGPVAVSGIARPAADMLDRPTKDGECLAFKRKTQVSHKEVDNNNEGGLDREVSSRTSHSSQEQSTAFYVEDDSGAVLISDEETPTLHLERTDSETEIPDDIEELEQEYHNRDSYSIVTKKVHRYSELLPGDEVFVFGKGHRGAISDGGHEDLEFDIDARITENSETGDFIVTTNDKEWLLDKYTDRIQLLIGIILTVLSIAFLAYIWML